MTTVLTGATGFLGLHLLRGLLAGHDRLVVLARGDPSAVIDVRPSHGRLDRRYLLAGIGR